MFTEEHILLTVIGSGFGDTWSIGLRMRKADGAGEPDTWDLQGLVNAAAAPTQTMHQSQDLSHPSNVSLLRIKAAAVDASGHYPAGVDAAEYVYPAAVVGVVKSANSSGQAFVIPQSTIAVTLTTDTQRGYASKGRIFLPPCVLPIDTAGRLSVADATALGTAIKTWINALNALPQAGLVTVESKGRGVKSVDANGKVTWTYPTGGASRPVTGVRVGRVVDTQRRRRRSLTELPVNVVL